MTALNPFISTPESSIEHDPNLPLESSIIQFPDQIGTLALPEANPDPDRILKHSIESDLVTPEITELQVVYARIKAQHEAAEREYELRDEVVARGLIPIPSLDTTSDHESEETLPPLKPIRGLPPQYALGISAVGSLYFLIGR
jgi:hypothetical protein